MGEEAMQIIYNITLTLWVVIFVLRAVDLVALDDKGCQIRVFYLFSRPIILITLLLSVFSAISLIWS